MSLEHTSYKDRNNLIMKYNYHQANKSFQIQFLQPCISLVM